MNVPQDRSSETQLGLLGRGTAQSAMQIDLFEVLRTLWRGKIWIGAVAFLFVIAAGYYAFKVATPLYRATAVIALEVRQEQIVDFQAAIAGVSTEQAAINTEIEIMRSRGLLGQVVDQLDLTQDPEFNSALLPPKKISVDKILKSVGLRETAEAQAPDLDKLRNAVIDKLRSRVSISNLSSSYVFQLRATTTSPTKSALIANTLAELYVTQQIAVKFEATEQATNWLSERVTTLKVELEYAESEVKAFAADTKLISPEALEGLSVQIKDTRARISGLETVLAELDARRGDLVTAIASADFAAIARVADDAAIDRLIAQDAEGAEILTAAQNTLDRLNLSRERTAAQIQSLTASIARLETEFEQQSEDLLKLQQLEREAEASRLIYEHFLSRLKETSVQQGIHQADSRILSHAIPPDFAFEPNKKSIVAMAMVLGIILASAVVLLRELTKTGFRTSDDLEQASRHSVIGQIPRIPSRRRSDVLQYLVDKPASAAAEAVRNLRTSVMLSNLDNPPQVILMTSSLPGEGKTTNSIALTQNFVGMGKKVLLIEGDIRRRVFSQYFDIALKDGLLAALTGDKSIDELVTRVDSLGADVMIGEEGSANAADVFSSSRFHDVMMELRERYDVIIIDTPPVLVVPDARIIANEADVVLFSVKWDATSREQVTEALRQFEIAGIKVTGLVLSLIDPKGMKRYGYGGRYGAYSAYGTKYYQN